VSTDLRDEEPPDEKRKKLLRDEGSSVRNEKKELKLYHSTRRVLLPGRKGRLLKWGKRRVGKLMSMQQGKGG